MRAEPPEVAGAADPRAGDGRASGGWIRPRAGRALRGSQRLDPKIDLARFEADRLDFEVEFDPCQSLKLFAEQPIAPDRDLGQTVVGDDEGAFLRLGEAFEADGGNFGETQPTRGRQPAVAGDDGAVAVDQNRDVEAEGFDAAGDLPDLLLAVPAGVGRVGLQAVQREIGDGQRALGPLRAGGLRGCGHFVSPDRAWLVASSDQDDLKLRIVNKLFLFFERLGFAGFPTPTRDELPVVPN